MRSNNLTREVGCNEKQDTGLVVGENKYENKPFNDFKREIYLVSTLGK